MIITAASVWASIDKSFGREDINDYSYILPVSLDAYPRKEASDFGSTYVDYSVDAQRTRFFCETHGLKTPVIFCLLYQDGYDEHLMEAVQEAGWYGGSEIYDSARQKVLAIFLPLIAQETYEGEMPGMTE